MSRHKIDTQDNFSVFVGWDNPMQTFFYQKYSDYDTKKEKIVDDVGTSYKALPTIKQLVALLKVFGYEMTVGQLSKLEEDYNNRTEPTPLQKMINDMFAK
jgi:hypothetical protein